MIEFDLPVAVSVQVTVYNILGQRVATLVDNEMEAGQHRVNFDGSRFASGLYFYRLVAGKFIETRKMILFMVILYF